MADSSHTRQKNETVTSKNSSTTTTPGVVSAANAADETPSLAFRDSKGILSLLMMVILGLIGLVAFASRLFAVIRFESIIHEFDPW